MCMTRSLNVTNKIVANYMCMTLSLNVTNKTGAKYMCMTCSLNVTNKPGPSRPVTIGHHRSSFILTPQQCDRHWGECMDI